MPNHGSKKSKIQADMAKIIVITGGTGGIGYQVALELSKSPGNTVVITGRSQGSGDKAVAAIKEASGNANVHLALGDLSLQSDVKKLAADLLTRFPKIDVLCNNAGNLSSVKENRPQTSEGVEKNFAVNVIAPLLLTRLLVPALKAASPVGNVLITSGGTPFPSLNVKDLEASSQGMGIPSYSHSKRAMEAMAFSLGKELASDAIAVNIAGGGNPGATSMTADISCSDLPCIMRPIYPCFKCFMHRDDGGASARACAAVTVWAASTPTAELGTGQYYFAQPNKKVAIPKPALDEANQAEVMAFCDSKMAGGGGPVAVEIGR
mmetsp:Transcript_87917/g.175865  ORF Transcript_87917/g.175865 Transcript_87917/m.175865 type:complete len:321 (+) Transcript_87917:40-1002(+)